MTTTSLKIELIDVLEHAVEMARKRDGRGLQQIIALLHAAPDTVERAEIAERAAVD